MEIAERVALQRKFFESGATRDLRLRKSALLLLENAIRSQEREIAEALCADLGKSGFESYMTEIGLALEEIGFQRRHLEEFAREKRVKTPLAQFPARSFLSPEPYGVVLVMSPWNYPFLLTLAPLASAIAAGNTVVLKPSAYSPNSSRLLERLLAGVFTPEYVTLVQGGRTENSALLAQKFDYIFFTGGQAVGREVMARAAEHLTPVTLELGGKSPCLVDKTADLPTAARRIAFGKSVNAGQTCVAPDYVLVDETVAEALILELSRAFAAFFGENPLENPNYGHIVNEKHFTRILGLLEGENVAFGGKSDEKTRKIEPTILRDVRAESRIMQEEIFGPLLPILTFRELSEATDFVCAREKPLALYLFTRSKENERLVLARCSFGGGCINDTLVHLASSSLPFGGVGGSGMGCYHGEAGFLTFTHLRGILKKSNRLDIPLRYPPHSARKSRLLHFFLK